MNNVWKNKRVVVTGSAGFLGTNFSLKLLSQGADVYGTYHNRFPRIEDPNFHPIQADLTTREGCQRACRDADFLVMTAAYVGGAEKILQEPMKFVTDTTVIYLYMLEAAYAAGIKKVLFVSSGMGYHESKKPLQEEEAMEGDPFIKYFGGGWSRRYGEVLCRMYSSIVSDPMDITAIRIDNIYGPYDSFKWHKSHVMAALIRKAVERMDPFEVWGDGQDYKDFIYVEDLVDGGLRALERAHGYHLYNIASGKNVTINEALKIILEEADYSDAKIVYNSEKPIMIPYKVTSIEKAKTELGFNPKTSLREGIQKTIEWYRNNPETVD